MKFELNGVQEGLFKHSPNITGAELLYNQLVFNKTGLVNTVHTLVMAAVPGSGTSLILFDWAEYT